MHCHEYNLPVPSPLYHNFKCQLSCWNIMGYRVWNLVSYTGTNNARVCISPETKGLLIFSLKIWPVLKTLIPKLNNKWKLDTYTGLKLPKFVFSPERLYFHKVKGLFKLVTVTIKTCSIYSISVEPKQCQINFVEIDMNSLCSTQWKQFPIWTTIDENLKDSVSSINLSTTIQEHTCFEGIFREEITLRPPPRGVRRWLRGYFTMVAYTLYTLSVSPWCVPMLGCLEYRYCT